MQQNTEFTLDFMDKELRKMAFNAFEIDNESKIILGIIAKNGPVNETEITRFGRRRISLTREVIRRRVMITDLANGYLSVKKGGKIRNLKKTEKKYSLTFKGFLASLHQVPLQENYWIKHYLHVIEQITDKNTSEYFLKHMYYHVISFFILNSKKIGMLTNNDTPETDFYDNYAFVGMFENLLANSYIKGIPIEYRDLFIFSYGQFFVSSEVIPSLVRIFLKIPLSTVKKHNKQYDDEYLQFEHVLDTFFRSWMWKMFKINDTSQILDLLDVEDDYFDKNDDEEIINVSNEYGDEMWDNFSFEANDEVKRIISKLNLNQNNFAYKKYGRISLIKT